MIPSNLQGVLGGVLIASLPWMASSYPSVGSFIYRSPNRWILLGACLLLGVGGLLGIQKGVLPHQVGFCFFAPLWQIFVVLISYFAWHRFHARQPERVDFNWKPGLFWDRILSMAILLLGAIPFFFIISKLRHAA